MVAQKKAACRLPFLKRSRLQAAGLGQQLAGHFLCFELMGQPLVKRIRSLTRLTKAILSVCPHAVTCFCYQTIQAHLLSPNGKFSLPEVIALLRSPGLHCFKHACHAHAEAAQRQTEHKLLGSDGYGRKSQAKSQRHMVTSLAWSGPIRSGG